MAKIRRVFSKFPIFRSEGAFRVQDNPGYVSQLHSKLIPNTITIISFYFPSRHKNRHKGDLGDGYCPQSEPEGGGCFHSFVQKGVL